ncbi:hypothetical protein CC1G_14911 [Coprinopsis cinerea okayama7|uniref:Uncharacterized protein n=1 Tax=Coprinopsis cinerea (strain Okayama-7 / 130 / ATCC MYA-4618 / FGSC 9003) TaxID=240176 RepID=D6RNS4_COPC7|nr:hypothetical protein CC1G_14911 [Coprinopsis cinerea okayama7\|eukprot:XP_002910934.1 hypothetical protein CC1G_14911 [Coprinopsis cinerea okayama7\
MFVLESTPRLLLRLLAYHPQYAAAVQQLVYQCTSFPTSSHFDLVLLAPLHVAARYGFHEILDSVLMGTAKGNVALRTSGGKEGLYGVDDSVETRENGDGGCTPWLFTTNGAGISAGRGQTALFHAVDSEAVVQCLLAHKGIKVNVTLTSVVDEGGGTALMHASNCGSASVVQLLLGVQDIDVIIANGEGDTALILASGLGHSEFVRHLLQHNRIDVYRKNAKGQTALMAAQEAPRIKRDCVSVREGSSEAIKLLAEFEKRAANSSN